MTIKHVTEVPAETVEEGAQGVKIRWLLAREDGAANFAMRHFELAPGGHTPRHTHAWEHEVFVLSGQGKVVGAHGESPLRPGSVVFVAPQDEHQFVNAGEGPLQLLCLIPLHEG
ncbi:MAG: cupin domain-containing protein [Candidatus Brocadiia bacterium]